MHAPEIPDWFVDEKINNMGQGDYYFFKHDQKIIFEWRRYYAEKMIEELSK